MSNLNIFALFSLRYEHHNEHTKARQATTAAADGADAGRALKGLPGCPGCSRCRCRRRRRRAALTTTLVAYQHHTARPPPLAPLISLSSRTCVCHPHAHVAPLSAAPADVPPPLGRREARVPPSTAGLHQDTYRGNGRRATASPSQRSVWQYPELEVFPPRRRTDKKASLGASCDPRASG